MVLGSIVCCRSKLNSRFPNIFVQELIVKLEEALYKIQSIG